MACFKKLDNPFIECPFNNQHKVLASKMQYHIVKCMKTHPGWKTCPYNACHRLKEEKDLKNHIIVCPNKKLAEDNTESNRMPNLAYHKLTNEEFNLEFEDWTKD